MPTLNYTLSEQAELAFAEAVDDVAPYLINHYQRGLGVSDVTVSYHRIKGGQSVAIITDPSMNLTLVWLKEEVDQLLQEAST